MVSTTQRGDRIAYLPQLLRRTAHAHFLFVSVMLLFSIEISITPHQSRSVQIMPYIREEVGTHHGRIDRSGISRGGGCSLIEVRMFHIFATDSAGIEQWPDDRTVAFMYIDIPRTQSAVKAVCKPRVFIQLLDYSAAQAVTFETTIRHDKGTSPTTGDARPVYAAVGHTDTARLIECAPTRERGLLLLSLDIPHIQTKRGGFPRFGNYTHIYGTY